jgi:hypothetical protein
MDPIVVDAPAAKPPAPPAAAAKPAALGLLAALPLTKKQLVGAGVAALSLCAGVGVVRFWSPAPDAPPEKHDAPVLARGATPKAEPSQTPQKLAPIVSPQVVPPQITPPVVPPLPSSTVPVQPPPASPMQWYAPAQKTLLEPLGHPGRGYTLDPRLFPEVKSWQLPLIQSAPTVAFAPASSWPNNPSPPGPLPAAVTPQPPVQPSGGFPQVPLPPPTVTPIQAVEPKAPGATPPSLPTVPDLSPKTPDLPAPVVVPDSKKVDPVLPLLPAGPAKVELPAVAPVAPTVTPAAPPSVTPLPNPVATPPVPMTPAVTPIPGAPVGPTGLPEPPSVAPPTVTPPAPTPPTLTPPTAVPTPPAVGPATPPALTPAPPAVTPTPPAIAPTPPGPAALPPVTPVGGARPPEATVTRTPQTSFDVDLHEPKAGETYEAISKAFYNDARYARALAAFNNNRPLQGGAMIEVPPVHVLRNRFGQQVGMGTTPVPPPAEPAFRTAGRRFVVPAGGMALTSVARQTLGSEARWRDIYDLNPQVSPGLVPAGTELRLPPDATGP